MNLPSRTLYLGCDSGVFRASRAADGRLELEPLGLVDAGVRALLFDPDDPLRLLAATRRAGLQRSVDGGRSWHERSAGVVHRDLWSLARCPAAGTLFVGAEPPALYRSDDGGETWVDCAALHALPESVHWTFPPPPHFAHVKHMAVHPTAPHAVYLALEEGWLVRTGDGGRSFVTLKQGVDFDAHGVLLTADEPRRVLAPTGAGVFASDDGGDTFAPSGLGLPARAYCSPPGPPPPRAPAPPARGARGPSRGGPPPCPRRPGRRGRRARRAGSTAATTAAAAGARWPVRSRPRACAAAPSTPTTRSASRSA